MIGFGVAMSLLLVMSLSSALPSLSQTPPAHEKQKFDWRTAVILHYGPLIKSNSLDACASLRSYGEERFDSIEWKKGLELCQPPRLRMLYDLCRTRLIGSSRSKIHDLLGQLTEPILNAVPSEEPVNDSEWYQVGYSQCGYGGQSYLELSYSENVVVGFRTIARCRKPTD